MVRSEIYLQKLQSRKCSLLDKKNFCYSYKHLQEGESRMSEMDVKAFAIILVFVIFINILGNIFSVTSKLCVSAQECDSSYPDMCITSPPPDLNCGDISEKNFRVLYPDPHKFDREGDGIGCEN
jgi:hypothetical protein